MNAFSSVNILSGPALWSCFAVAVLFLMALVFGVFGRRFDGRDSLFRWAARLAIGAAVGVATGLVLSWLVGSVWDVFGVALTPLTTLWLCFMFGGVGIAICNFSGTRWWSRLVAAVGIVVVVVTGALGINVDVGYYSTLGSIVQPPPPVAGFASRSPSSATRSDQPVYKTWVAPRDLPQTGKLESAIIPGTKSHFPARPAVIYLPPAALVADPPALPVMVMLSGQPGDTSQLFVSGQYQESLDEFQRAHHGLTPIIVAADQLGNPASNPMCVDSPIGNSATYLTVDVPTWIRNHLHVLKSPRYWGIGGFSQGGTCAIQLGAGYPQVYGTLLDISGELAPRNGSLSHTIDVGFGGSRSAFEAAEPLNVLERHAPYADSEGIFAVGQDDARYGPGVRTLREAATKAGMTTRYFESPGTGHDFHTATYALKHSLPLLAVRLGLVAP